MRIAFTVLVKISQARSMFKIMPRLKLNPALIEYIVRTVSVYC